MGENVWGGIRDEGGENVILGLTLEVLTFGMIIQKKKNVPFL
jgi:hypothetical protein